MVNMWTGFVGLMEVALPIPLAERLVDRLRVSFLRGRRGLVGIEQIAAKEFAL